MQGSCCLGTTWYKPVIIGCKSQELANFLDIGWNGIGSNSFHSCSIGLQTLCSDNMAKELYLTLNKVTLVWFQLQTTVRNPLNHLLNVLAMVFQVP